MMEKYNNIKKILEVTQKYQGQFFDINVFKTAVVPEIIINKQLDFFTDQVNNVLCISDYGEYIYHLKKKFGNEVKIYCIPSTINGYNMTLQFMSMFESNPSDFVIFNKEKYLSLSIDKYFEYIINEINMNFDIGVGNPPYNNGNTQIYPKFYIWAKQKCNEVCMIFPTSWQGPKNKNGLSIMNNVEIKQDRQIVYIDNIDYAFEGVTGAKKTNIIHWKKGYNNGLDGKQRVYSNGSNPKDIKFDIDCTNNYEELVNFGKLMSNSDGFKKIKDTVYMKPYGIRTYFSDDSHTLPPMRDEKKYGDITVFGITGKSKKTKKYIDSDYNLPKISKSLKKYKVFIPSVWGNLNEEFIGGSYGNIYIARPFDICTESFLESGCFNDLETVRKHSKYIVCKFFRALLYINKSTIFNSLKCYEYIPIQDYSEDWWNTDDIGEIDEHLFDKYDVPEYIREFVRKNIQPRTVGNIVGYFDEESDTYIETQNDIEQEESAEYGELKKKHSNEYDLWKRDLKAGRTIYGDFRDYLEIVCDVDLPEED